INLLEVVVLLPCYANNKLTSSISETKLNIHKISPIFSLTSPTITPTVSIEVCQKTTLLRQPLRTWVLQQRSATHSWTGVLLIPLPSKSLLCRSHYQPHISSVRQAQEVS